jgi:chemotaxis protein methyltransferase CheR
MAEEHTQGAPGTDPFIENFGAILDSIRGPVLILDKHFRVIRANRSFYQTFKVNAEETEGTIIYDLGDKQWDIPKLRDLLENILPKNSIFDDFEVEHTFESIGRKIMHLNAHKIENEVSRTQLIFLAIEDVTEREYYTKDLEELVINRTAELDEAKKEAEKGK